MQSLTMCHSQPDCNSASGRCNTNLIIVSGVENDTELKLRKTVRLRVKEAVDNQTMLEAAEESNMDATNNMTLEQNSSMRAIRQGSISVIAGKLSGVVPKAYESLPFE